MEIYIFRHGIAEDAKSGEPDAARRLTEEGKQKSAAVARIAKEGGVKLSSILSSPFTRALETARIAAEELGYKGGIVTAPELSPHGSPESIWNLIRERRDESAILISGHEPLLSHTVSYLLASPALRIEMKKSALVRIDMDAFGAMPHGVLRWMVIPRLTRC